MNDIYERLTGQYPLRLGDRQYAAAEIARLRAEVQHLRTGWITLQIDIGDLIPAIDGERANDPMINRVKRVVTELTEARKPDCRTCQHFYSDFDLGEAQCGFNNTGVGILCVAGDRHEPFDPVRLYAIDAAMAGGEHGDA